MNKISYFYYTQTMREVRCAGNILTRQGDIVTYVNKDSEQVRTNIYSPHVHNVKITKGTPHVE